MAFYPSKDAVFQVTDTAAQLRDLSPYIVSIDGLPGERELIEVTALGDGGRKWIPGLENVTFSIEFHWSEDASVGPDTVLGPLRTHTAAVAFDYGPEGKVATDIKYSGTCWVRNFVVTSRVGAEVVARGDFQAEGTITRGAYT